MLNAMKFSLLAGGLLVLPVTAAHAAMTAEQCDAAFTKADTNGDGSLGQNESAKYIELMTKNSITTKDADIVSKQEYTDACTKGTFDGM